MSRLRVCKECGNLRSQEKCHHCWFIEKGVIKPDACPFCLVDTLTEQVRAQDKWIDVDVELPKDEQKVLSTDELGRVYLSTYLRGKFKLLFHCADHCYVTHWMPLPTPPKEAE